MGITTGTVVGQSIESYRGSPEVRMLKVQLLGDSPETIEFINVSGEDTAPADGDRVVVFDLGGGYKVTFGTKDQIVAAVDPGEKEIYSHSDESKLARLKLKGDGSIGVKNESEGIDYKQVMTALVDAIKNIETFGSPTSHVLTANSKLALDNALTDVLKIFTEI